MIFYSQRFLEHRNNAVECPERLEVARDYLKERGVAFKEPREADEKEILLAHSEKLISTLKKNSEKEAFFPDNAFHRNTYEIAKLAAGAACGAAEEALRGNFSFALLRPPGHHASRDSFGGFCYLNNIAIAVKKILGSAGRVLIVDFDAHHGNGTQAIFYSEPNVFYLSLHQEPRTLYPGTGFESENNEHVLNVPLPPFTGSETYLKKFSSALARGKKFKPEILAISAGFDSYIKDPLAQLKLETYAYEKIGKELANLGIPSFAVLEGGYYLPELGRNIYAFLKPFISGTLL